MSAIPLPVGDNNAPDMIRRLRAIDAEFFGTLYAAAGIIGGDVEIRGTLSANDIHSSTWDGDIPLALPDSAATQGYALQDDTGIGQFTELHATGEFLTAIVASTITVGQLSTSQIENLAINEALIAANAVTVDKVANLAIATGKLALDAVTEAQLADLAVGSEHVQLLAITEGLVAANAITVSKVANLAIETGKLALDAVTDAQLADLAVGNEHIQALSITAAEIAALTITAAEIAALTITASEIAANTITAAEIAANTVTAAEIAALTITASELKADSVIASKILAGEIATSHMTVGTIDADRLTALSITAAEIKADTITSAEIAANTITASEIFANTITASEIAAGTITATEIAAGTITATEILAGTITAAEMTIASLDAITATMGALTVDGTLTMGSSGKIRTAAAGTRLEIQGSGVTTRISFYDASGVLSYIQEGNLKDISFIAGDGLASMHLRGTVGDPHLIFGTDTRLRLGAGTALKPAFSWSADPDTGMYWAAANHIAFSTAGTKSGLINSTGNFNWRVGTAAAPAYSFDGDIDTGMYRHSANRLAFSTSGTRAWIMELVNTDQSRFIPNDTSGNFYDSFIQFDSGAKTWGLHLNGVVELLLGATGFLVTNVYNTNNTGGSNVRVDSDGRLHRDSSSLKVKDNVVKVDAATLTELAEIRLEPATWTKHGVKDMGLIADWLDVQHPLLGVYDGDGEIDDYRDRAVMAVMVAKINRLEAQVKEMLV